LSDGARDALLDQIPDPLVLVDHQARVIKANRAARALLPALQVHQPLSFALRHPDVLEALNNVTEAGGALTADFSQRIPVERQFEVQITVLDAAGQHAKARPSILLFFRDLTAAWRIERMRADFVANASHELRTPLASILGFIETLQGPARNDPAARERFLAIMRDQAKRMTRLIDDLLSLARIEMRAHLPVTTAVDLNAVATQVCRALEPLAQERSVTIAISGSEQPLRVLGDRDELVRVAENVIENAIKYGESGQKVEIELRQLDAIEGRMQAVELSVRDYGPGIASEHLPRLTERFYRVDPTASRQQGGTGLGLAIVKHIVNRHGGRLAIESERGRGTTVRIILPNQGRTAGAGCTA
jgi:two-component system, OmpR family, phosphate regulon sensor histidine kinase PhoR